MSVVFWFRKDLRLQDNEALSEAASSSEKICPVYLLDNPKYQHLEGIRQHSLTESLRSLNKSIGDNLNVLNVSASEELCQRLVEAVGAVGATKVFAMRRFDPEGVQEQHILDEALRAKGYQLILVGSAYAVPPGTVRKPDGSNYRVYTPFFNSWNQLANIAPFDLETENISWLPLKENDGIPDPSKASKFQVVAGEAFALRTFSRFKKRALGGYSVDRNRADLSGTSHLSHALAHGEIHPRTLLAELGDDEGSFVFRKEIAWREFYADVLHHYPHTLNDYYEPRFKTLRYDVGPEAEKRFQAWREGNTGYPMVDAGMRQLLAEGWMHNRLRMIVASFLVKDLHLEWTLGAEHFERHLSDFDPASNSHGWQWTAGCGTDASPYYRIFNPIMQGLKFDPDGNFVRKYIPELRHLQGVEVHEPWTLFNGYDLGYPEQIVDHFVERNEALSRLEEIKNSN